MLWISTGRWTTALALLLVLVPAMALGQGIVPCDGLKCTPCHLLTLIKNLLEFGIEIIIVLSAILFAYAGWLYITAGGKPGSTERAKRVFIDVLIGLFLVIAAWLIVETLINVLTDGNISLRGSGTC